jgi:2Fe-2S ferredoxin
MDVLIKKKDREEESCTSSSTDMAMNIMELCKAYELPVEGTCGGMAMCASCQCYVLNEVAFAQMGGMGNHAIRAFTSKLIVV